jgi:hypothetical protein
VYRSFTVATRYYFLLHGRNDNKNETEGVGFTAEVNLVEVHTDGW